MPAADSFVERLATLFFRNRHLLVLSTVVVLVAGFAAMESLPRLEDPIITQRNPLVLTSLPGASAERVEALVSKPIEDALAEIPEIKTLASTSRDGFSLVSIELKDSVTRMTNEAVFSRIRDQLRRAAASLPAGASTPEFDDKRGAVAFSLVAGVVWTGDGQAPAGVLNRHAEALADRLRNVGGTELVRLYGVPEEEFLVAVDAVSLTARGLTIDDVADALRAADTKAPAGVLQARDAQIAVEITAEFDTAERLGAVPLRHDAGRGIVHVRDVATVTRGWREPLAAEASADGRAAIFVAARVQSDQRVDRWSAAALRVLEEHRAGLGRGVELDVVFEQNRYTAERLGELAFNLLLGALVVVGVVLVTMGWRAALIVGSTLPLSAAATLFLVSLGGGSLQQMSIFGMILAIGLLIDNAIVMTDEVHARLTAGAARIEAVSGAVRHLFMPLLASSLTTIFAFAPILLLPGNAGDFVSSIGGSVILAIATSFVVATTLIAAYAGIFGRAQRASGRRSAWRDGLGAPAASARFEAALRWALRRPWRAMLLGLAVPAVGFVLGARLNVEFFPPTDRDMFSVRVWLPENAALAETTATLRAIETDLRARPEVRRVHWLAGGSFPSVYYNLVMRNDNEPGFGQIVVVTSSAADVGPLLEHIEGGYAARFPGAQVVANRFGQGPPVDAEVEFRVVGDDLAALREAGAEVRRAVAAHPRIQTTRTTTPDGAMKLWFTPDLPEIELAGWTPARIAAELQGRLSGREAGVVLEDLEPMPVRVRFAGDARDTPEALRDQWLPDPEGRAIPLVALGQWEFRPAQGVITRRNRERVSTIQGFVTANTLPIGVTNDVLARLANPDETPPLPPGVRLQLGGDAENQSDAVGNLTLFVPILVILTLGVLVLSFRSTAVAMILSVVAFLSVGFGLLATWASGFPLSFNTLLGCLGLVGLAFNASIVVVAAIRADAAALAGEADAIVRAVAGCGRHLTSTTLTTIGGCLPLLFFIGGDFWPPLAVVLVGGVAGSTLLALFLTPVLHRRFATTHINEIGAGKVA